MSGHKENSSPELKGAVTDRNEFQVCLTCTELFYKRRLLSEPTKLAKDFKAQASPVFLREREAVEGRGNSAGSAVRI